MKQANFHKLVGDQRVALDMACHLYAQLRAAALRENDLRTFVGADLTLATLEHAKDVFEEPVFYAEPPHYYKADPEDELEKLYQMRLAYVKNYVIARA